MSSALSDRVTERTSEVTTETLESKLTVLVPRGSSKPEWLDK